MRDRNVPMISGAEMDALSPKARKHFLFRAGVRAAVKRGYIRRSRHAARVAAKHFQEA